MESIEELLELISEEASKQAISREKIEKWSKLIRTQARSIGLSPEELITVAEAISRAKFRYGIYSLSTVYQLQTRLIQALLPQGVVPAKAIAWLLAGIGAQDDVARLDIFRWLLLVWDLLELKQGALSTILFSTLLSYIDRTPLVTVIAELILRLSTTVDLSPHARYGTPYQRPHVVQRLNDAKAKHAGKQARAISAVLRFVCLTAGYLRPSNQSLCR